MKVTRQGTTFLVDINISSESPQKAAAIANAIADRYFEEQVRAKFDATRIVANVRAQLKDTQRLIKEEIQRIVQSTKHDYDVARSREASLQDSFDKLQGVSSSSGQAMVRLHELQREAEANRTQYESYLARSK